jgi:hypothetical protein
MSFYVYHKSDSRIASNPARGKSYLKAEYATEGAAKAAVTRMVKKANERYNKLMASQYDWDHEKARRVIAETKDLAIAESTDYHKNIEEFETVYSMMDKDKTNPIRQSVNTPAYCDPSRESYWSM